MFTNENAQFISNNLILISKQMHSPFTACLSLLSWISLYLDNLLVLSLQKT